MPVMVREQARGADGLNYQVCGLCGSLNRMGQIYGPIYMVYKEGCGPVTAEGVAPKPGARMRLVKTGWMCHYCGFTPNERFLRIQHAVRQLHIRGE